MAKKKKPAERPENGPVSAFSYGLINDGNVAASIAIDMNTKAIVGTVLDQKDGRTYYFAADLKEG